MKASVIICTYNRSKLLLDTLVSLKNQDFPRDIFEIIVVDNNSTDNTKELVLKLAPAFPIQIKYIYEEKQGLSFARNTGITHAHGQIIAFTDDDVEAEKTWLKSLVSVFQSPDVYGAGGPIRAIWPCELPSWLTDYWQRYLTINEFPEAHKMGEFKSPFDYPWGANMAFHKKVFDTIGIFPTNLGRVGSLLLSNEELELYSRIEAQGKRIVFAPGAIIYHKIPCERMTKQWFYKRTYYQGRSEAMLSLNTKGPLYNHLRSEAQAMVNNLVNRERADFDVTCFHRAHRGFFHQLLLYVKEDNKVSHTRELRVLETFMTEVIKSFLNHLETHDSVNSEIKAALKTQGEELRTMAERIKYLEAALAQVRNSLAYKIYAGTLKLLKKKIKIFK
jgi:glycosyltransferase involved in cell wall biosynthesis